MSTTTKPAPGARTSDRARDETRMGWLLSGPAVLVLLAVTAYPILQAFYQSLFNYRLTDPDARYFNWGYNYVVVLGDPQWWQTLGFTLLVTVFTVAIELVLGFALALVMLNAVRTVRPWLRTVILIPYGIITVVSAFSWKYAFDLGTGFVGAWTGNPGFDWFGDFWTAFLVISAAEIWKTTPFISLLLLAGLAQIPGDMLEAAKVDGATWWQRMTKVILPNMTASIMVALLFRTLDAFRIFDSVFVMTSGAQGTATVSFLAYAQTISQLQVGLGSAVSVLLFACVALICFIFIKLFRVDLSRARGE
ncbi:carbohydrate ABC transporter permease [Sediminivirga luteola]|uniref:Putative sugar ABC transporter, permease protein SugA n=1 Tax=Sediminivirga luteola TaxID=1774748 RepID=A0A8J2TX98_9MICO|nr:sugar ABC transporter permease [Sediminivirga luteola]MCI2266424.1 sugar ABC transporter permease [Sediminivirga luteola]GGA11652.1 putative sugar ABC transporter, permease protein SugA [Sediminivirga luteola]